MTRYLIFYHHPALKKQIFSQFLAKNINNYDPIELKKKKKYISPSWFHIQVQQNTPKAAITKIVHRIGKLCEFDVILFGKTKDQRSNYTALQLKSFDKQLTNTK